MRRYGQTCENAYFVNDLTLVGISMWVTATARFYAGSRHNGVRNAIFRDGDQLYTRWLVGSGVATRPLIEQKRLRTLQVQQVLRRRAQVTRTFPASTVRVPGALRVHRRVVLQRRTSR